MSAEGKKAEEAAKAVRMVIYNFASEEAKKLAEHFDGAYFWDMLSVIHLLLFKAELIRHDLIAESEKKDHLIRKLYMLASKPNKEEADIFFAGVDLTNDERRLLKYILEGK